MKKCICILGLALLLAAVFFHAQQIWPVHKRDVIGVYRNTQNSDDIIYLKLNGGFEHRTVQQKYTGKWNMNKWDEDVTIVSLQFEGKQEFYSSYVIGSRFGRVENLYITDKLDAEWRKAEK